MSACCSIISPLYFRYTSNILPLYRPRAPLVHLWGPRRQNGVSAESVPGFDSAGLSAIQMKLPFAVNPPSSRVNCHSPALAARSSSTTKKPDFDSGLSATFYTENYFKSSLDAAPQIYACQPHTVRLLRFCITDDDNIPEPLSPSCHQLWGQGKTRQNGRKTALPPRAVTAGGGCCPSRPCVWRPGVLSSTRRFGDVYQGWRSNAARRCELTPGCYL
jgi:hypothetical protein